LKTVDLGLCFEFDAFRQATLGFAMFIETNAIKKM